MKNLYFLLLAFLLFSCKKTEPPVTFGALPSPQQLAWHEMEYYAFVHFNINTFSDVEWGHGKEKPAIFNPTQLDCRQWARVCKAAGMKAIIITAKHHDGFCLWDSKYTEHDVASSPWRGGKGDLLRELADACKEYGLKMGIYMSPWDQNAPVYGKPEYNEYFKKQLEEALTQYGDIFEVWFDGAVGEEYKGIMVYDWKGFHEVVRRCQPNAVMFSDAGPDVRWVGNENGFANRTNWCTLNRDDYFPGTPRYVELRSGNKNGTHWLPAEADVSIRPGWYYHPEQDSLVKTPDQLEAIYYKSAGRSANLLLNLPVDRRGLVHENDSAALMQLRQRLDATFTNNLAAGQTAVAENIRGKAKEYAAAHLLDGNNSTYWTTDDAVKTAVVEVQLSQPQRINVLALREYLPLGQRVEVFSVEAKAQGQWQRLGNGTTIGNKRLLTFPPIEAEAFKISVTGMAPPALSEIGLYFRPHENKLLENLEAAD
jgi:alpha-L-fucosidase